MQTIALVTLYNPQAENISNVKRIAEQVDCIYVLDNSDTGIAEAFEGCTNVIYHCFEQNMGIPLAFNYILKNSSLFDPEDYIIFFDQDSKINDGHIASLTASYEKLCALSPKMGGALGPAFTDVDGNISTPPVNNELAEDMYRIGHLITSSMLTQYKVLSEVGFWNEDLFLDGVDLDLCMRLEKAEYICCMVTNVLFRHEIGTGYLHVGPFRVPKQAPIRCYYYTRDYIYLLRQSYTILPMKLWFFRNITLINFLRVLLFPDRRAYAHYMKRGYIDALHHVTGRLEE